MFNLEASQTLSGVAGTASAVTYTINLDELTTADAFKSPQGQLPSSVGTLYTAPGAGAMVLVKSVVLSNATGSQVTGIKLFKTATAAANQITGTFSIPANGTAIYTGEILQIADGTGAIVSTTSVTLTGDVTGTGLGSVATTLTTFGPGAVGPFGTAGRTPVITTDAKGRVSALTDIAITPAGIGAPSGSGTHTGTSSNTNTGDQTTSNADGTIGVATGATNPVLTRPAITGDVSVPGGSNTATLAATGPGATGPIGSTSTTPSVTIDAKGRVTALASNTITPAAIAAVPTTRTITTTTPLTIDGGASADLSANRTLALPAASTTVNGYLTSTDKTRLNGLQYDAVADFGWVGNDSTDNLGAFNTMKAALPVGAAVWFPAGTYRVSGECTIDVDKRIQFHGAGRYNSIIKTTSLTANIFNITVPAWYNNWTDLGFQSSVTKTAGAAIAITSGSAVGTNIYRAWITGLFRGIDASGSQSGNLSVWSDLDISGIPNGGRGIKIDGSTINVQIHNTTINAGAATTSACCEINQSGAVQVTSFDWIQGTNVILLNSTGGAGPQAVYFTNGFCDQPQGSVVKIVGTNTANRIKFTEVGIAPTGNNYGVEINGTGAGAVGTTTALPAGISIVDADIYSQNGTNTASGIFVNGCQDINVQNTRVTGFAGAGGSGIRVAASASNQTKVRINGCIIGPNSNLTVNNTVAIQLDAGASGLGALSITDNTLTGNGTAITDASTMAVGASKNINNNPGAVSGLSAQLSSAAGITLTTTEQVLLQIPLPANSLRVGTTFRFTCTGTSTATTATFRIRIGTAGTIADAGLVGMGPTATMVAGGLIAEGQSQVTLVGASGTHAGSIDVLSATATSTLAPTLSGTFNTTVANFISVCALSGASGPIVRTGSLDIISPA